MTSINQKNQIVESLDSLDQDQTKKVLDYITSMIHSSSRDDKRIKREALRQIRQALGNSRTLNPTF
ncbi:MAG TPA: hypothetical protein VGD65_04600 [Chryseosolibacter sp.]